jgi:hypothetical protein
MNTEIKSENFHVWYDSENQSVCFKGSLRLKGNNSYESISTLLKEVSASGIDLMILDLRELEFLNSSGINIFYKFVMSMKTKKNVKVKVLGSSETPWQKKSLENMKHFLNTIEIEYI